MSRTQVTAAPGVPQILITREFDAPRELLFRAHIDPHLLVQWLGPRRLTMTVDRLEPYHGGIWRYIYWDPVDGDFAFRGVFHGTPSPDGIIQTFESERMPGHVSMTSVTFTEHGDKTMLSHNSLFQSVEDRDRELQYGIGDEADDSMERLDSVLARIAPVS